MILEKWSKVLTSTHTQLHPRSQKATKCPVGPVYLVQEILDVFEILLKLESAILSSRELQRLLSWKGRDLSSKILMVSRYEVKPKVW
jgi:hypothetical protein